MESNPFMLVNTREGDQPRVLPDLGEPAGDHEHSATSDHWGHVCSARLGVPCCGQCRRNPFALKTKQPNEPS
jgi:hypothetical protein